MDLEAITNTIINADCLDILRQLPDKCIDLILTDPPYFGIVKNDWDNQWKNVHEFQQWIGILAIEFRRVLKNNGALYWFCDDKMAAYCQVELDKYFHLLNHLVWNKPSTVQLKGYTSHRSYMTLTERILFYEQKTAYGLPATGLQQIHSNANCFASIKQYMREEKAKLMSAKGMKTEKEFCDFINELTQTKGMSRHYWADSQWILPTAEIYARLQSTGFFRKEYEELRKEYEELRKEYEELRKEYEELRRPWWPDITARDVLQFNTIAQHNDKKIHPTQKPLNILKYLLARSTKEGALVLDCFSGSGSIAVACHEMRRYFIAIEKDLNYYAASVKRLEEVQRQLTFDF